MEPAYLPLIEPVYITKLKSFYTSQIEPEILPQRSSLTNPTNRTDRPGLTCTKLTVLLTLKLIEPNLPAQNWPYLLEQTNLDLHRSNTTYPHRPSMTPLHRTSLITCTERADLLAQNEQITSTDLTGLAWTDRTGLACTYLTRHTCTDRTQFTCTERAQLISICQTQFASTDPAWQRHTSNWTDFEQCLDSSGLLVCHFLCRHAARGGFLSSLPRANTTFNVDALQMQVQTSCFDRFVAARNKVPCAVTGCVNGCLVGCISF